MIAAAPTAREHLSRLADRPRPAGSAAELAALDYCRSVLRGNGFAVRDEPFHYSAFPGRYATSVGGLLSTIVLVMAMVANAAGLMWLGALTLVVGGGGLALAVAWTARAGVLEAPWMRRRGVNLAATRGGDDPSLWLVAHIDTKSQPIPMLVRVAAIVLHGGTWIAAVVATALGLAGGGGDSWIMVAMAAVVTGAPIVASLVGDRSAGAVDNASGVAAILATVAAIPLAIPVGVLITSAEELGLAGARAFVRGHPPRVALNCDGIDDSGTLTCMVSGRTPARLVAAYERAALAEGGTLRVRRLLPGVLVDSVAFANAGWETATLSRGTIATLARIHTHRDNLASLTGAGIDDAARVLARVAQELS